MVLVAGLLSLDGARAEAPTTTLHAVFPAIAATGSSTVMQLAGGGQLEDVRQLRFSHPGITATPITHGTWPFSEQPRFEDGRFQVQIAADVPPGRYEVWAVGRWGLSNPRTFLVTNGPVQRLSDEQATRDSPAELPIDEIVCGRFAAQRRSAFRFAVAADERVKIRIGSAMVDSRAIPQAVLRDRRGREVAWAGGPTQPPLRVDWTAPQAEEMTLEVWDTVYGGGPELSFAIVRLGATEETAWFPADRQPALGRLPTAAAGIERWYDEPLVLIDETEADGDPPPAVVTLPAIIRGRFDRPRDRDVFEFAAEAGTAWDLELLSRSVDQWTLPRLRLLQLQPQADGSETWSSLAIADSHSSDSHPLAPAPLDARLSFTAPVTTRYRIAVEDLQGGERPTEYAGYRLRIAASQPEVDAVVYWADLPREVAQMQPRGTCLTRGGSIPLGIAIHRRGGFTGPVNLQAIGLPTGVQAAPTIIGPEQSTGHLVLTAAPDAPAWSGPIEIEITFDPTAGQSLRRIARPATVVWGPDAQRGAASARLTDSMILVVDGAATAPLQCSTGDTTELSVAQGASLTIPIQLVRSAGSASAVKLRPRDLPTGTSMSDLDLAADAVTGNAELKVAADAPLGSRTFWWLIETKLKLRPDLHELNLAEQYRAQLQSILDDPARAADHAAVAEAIPPADQRLEAARTRTAEAEHDVVLASPPVRIRIVAPAGS
jgi:hypothetical protein